ncbi:MAG: nucleotidyltransferase family protein [Halarsenatibacteraceae bacterium]
MADTKRNKQKKYPLAFAEPDPVEEEKSRQKAINTAREIAEVLKNRFQARKVWLFGSTLSENRYSSKWSDIDLAVRDIDARKYYQAISYIQWNYPKIEFDLIDIDDCKESVKDQILSKGVEL